MLRPSSLVPGSKVGIISTARKISREELEPACNFLRSNQLEPVFADNLFGSDHQFSGSDEQRAADLQQMIRREDISAILCARGGYGSVRIVDRVDFSPLQKKPKWICGYSDVSVIHNKLQKLGLESLHCSMPINFSTNTPAALQSILDSWQGRPPQYEWEQHPFNRQGEISGELIGGNLSVIYSQTGSPTALDCKGKILFLEDLDEYLYHVDRMLQNFKRAGYFDHLGGLVIGAMSDMNDNTIPFGKTALEIIRDTVSEYDFPVAFAFPAGHIDDNRALILGANVILKVGKSAKLQYHE